MSYIKFNKSNDKINTVIRPINDNVIEVIGHQYDISGVKMYLDNDVMVGDYSDYTTLYRAIDESTFQYSNDKSVYVEPIIPEPIPIPEPTEEELAEIARQNKVAQIQSQIGVIDAEFASLDYVGIKIATGRAILEEYEIEIARMNELAIMKNSLEEELKLV